MKTCKWLDSNEGDWCMLDGGICLVHLDFRSPYLLNEFTDCPTWEPDEEGKQLCLFPDETVDKTEERKRREHSAIPCPRRNDCARGRMFGICPIAPGPET